MTKRNPVKGMPGGSVSGCIKKKKGKVRDPGAYCAAIADDIEPGWRKRKNPMKRRLTRNGKKTAKKRVGKKTTLTGKKRTVKKKTSTRRNKKKRNAPSKSPSARQPLAKLEEDLSFVEGALSAAQTKGQKQDLRKLRDDLKKAIREKVGSAISRDSLTGLRQKSGELAEAIRSARTAGQKSMYRALKKRVDAEIRKRATGGKKSAKKKTAKRRAKKKTTTRRAKKKTSKRRTKKKKTATRRSKRSTTKRTRTYTKAELAKMRASLRSVLKKLRPRAGDTPEMKAKKRTAAAALRAEWKKVEEAAACRLGQRAARARGQTPKGKCPPPKMTVKESATALGYARARSARQKTPSIGEILKAVDAS